MGSRIITVRGVNGRAVARATVSGSGSVVGAALGLYVFLHVALVAALVALVVVLVVLVVRVVRARRPVAPVAVPARIDDAAARAHRARMAAILNR